MKPLAPLACLCSSLFVALCAAPAFADAGKLPPAVVTLGHLHLLLLHFPIAVLVCVLLIEVALRKRAPETRRDVISVLMIIGALGAVVAAGTGLVYAVEEEFHGAAATLLTQHRTGGIVTAVLAVAAAVAHRRVELRSAYLPLLVVAVIGVSFTGHRGGQLVHGPDYLLEAFDGEGDTDEGPDRIVASDGDENAVDQRLRHPEGVVPEKPDYAKDIKPIIDRSCLKCHGPEKRKSGLRLDKKRFALKGGETGPAIVPGDLATSLMYKYISLPADDEDVMPSKGKLLANSEVETIKKWILAGAEWPDE